MCYCYYICVVPGVESFSVLPIYVYDPTLEECDCETKDPYTFSEYALAYTIPHGMKLERREHPWGDMGDIFPFSQELFERLRQFAENDDLDGYALFFQREAEYMFGINYDDGGE